jgi:hypothetical protein
MEHHVRILYRLGQVGRLNGTPQLLRLSYGVSPWFCPSRTTLPFAEHCVIAQRCGLRNYLACRTVNDTRRTRFTSTLVDGMTVEKKGKRTSAVKCSLQWKSRLGCNDQQFETRQFGGPYQHTTGALEAHGGGSDRRGDLLEAMHA